MCHNRRMESCTQLTDYSQENRKWRKYIPFRKSCIFSACVRIYLKNSICMDTGSRICHIHTVICIHMCKENTHNSLKDNYQNCHPEIYRSIFGKNIRQMSFIFCKAEYPHSCKHQRNSSVPHSKKVQR